MQICLLLGFSKADKLEFADSVWEAAQTKAVPHLYEGMTTLAAMLNSLEMRAIA